jgi:hypothetical protein
MQLDFLTYTETREAQQLNFFDDKNRVHIQKCDKRDVEKFFASITEDEVIDTSLCMAEAQMHQRYRSVPKMVVCFLLSPHILRIEYARLSRHQRFYRMV